MDPWLVGYGKLREALVQSNTVEVASCDKWRLPYIWKLLQQRREAHLFGLEAEEEELCVLIESLVIN